MKPIQLSVQTIDYCNINSINAVHFARWLNTIKTELKRINHKNNLIKKS